MSVWVEWLSSNLAIKFDVDALYFYNSFPFFHVLTLRESIKKILYKKICIFRNTLLLCVPVLNLLQSNP